MHKSDHYTRFLAEIQLDQWLLEEKKLPPGVGFCR